MLGARAFTSVDEDFEIGGVFAAEPEPPCVAVLVLRKGSVGRAGIAEAMADGEPAGFVECKTAETPIARAAVDAASCVDFSRI